MWWISGASYPAEITPRWRLVWPGRKSPSPVLIARVHGRGSRPSCCISSSGGGRGGGVAFVLINNAFFTTGLALHVCQPLVMVLQTAPDYCKLADMSVKPIQNFG